MAKIVWRLYAVVFFFALGVMLAHAYTPATSQGYVVEIDGWKRTGDAVSQEHDFGVSYQAHTLKLVCADDYVVVYKVYDGSLLVAPRLQITLRGTFDDYGIFVNHVRVTETQGSDTSIVCERWNIRMRR